MKSDGSREPFDRVRGEPAGGSDTSSPSRSVERSSPPTAKRKTIALLGIPVSSRNQGVQALGASLVDLCMRAAPDAAITLLVGNSRPELVRYRSQGAEVLVPVVNYRLSPKSAPRDHLVWIVAMAVLYRLLPFSAARGLISKSTPWIEALENSVFAGDIRGGDSFSDIYGMKSFLIGFVQAWTILLVKGSMVQFPQTFGPFKSPIAAKLARYLLRSSKLIVARDTTSQRVAQDLVGPSQKVLLSPDVAFSLEVERPERPELDPPLSEHAPTGVVGINVNGLMYHGGYTRNNMFGLKMDYPGYLRKLVLGMLGEQPHDVWLVPHTYAAEGDVESDPDASRQLLHSIPEELRRRVRIVTAEYDQHQVKGVIGMCDFFIGSRMHSCIAALSQGIPCVGVAYSRKFQGVFESVGMADWVVDGREADNDEAVRQTISLYRQREDIRGELRKNAFEARDRLAVVFRGLMNETGPG